MSDFQLDPQEVSEGEERVVLARRTPDAFVPFQWTGQEPGGLDDIDLAEDLGCRWEGDELVTYNLRALEHTLGALRDGYQSDPD